MKAVIVEQVTFDYGPWLSLSPAGLDFVQGLLQRDPATRMTVSDALRHPWLAEQLGADACTPVAHANDGTSRWGNNILPYANNGGASGRHAPRASTGAVH